MNSARAAARAQAAEDGGDFARAAMWWNYAALALCGNPHGLRTTYCQREDAAKARARELEELRAMPDSEIDLTDMPESDFKGGARGRFKGQP